MICGYSQTKQHSELQCYCTECDHNKHSHQINAFHSSQSTIIRKHINQCPHPKLPLQKRNLDIIWLVLVHNSRHLSLFSNSLAMDSSGP